MLRRLLLRWVYKHIDRALFVGTRNREYFLAHGLKESELIFVPHAIDNARFSEPGQVYEQEAAEWRRQLGIAPADKVILFAGKLEPKKNPFFLLELARKLKDKNTWILIAGNGPLEKALKEEAKGLERVVFLDFQNQQKMPVLYRVGDLFVLPSKGPGETWGLAVNEAMACRRPVMVSAQCGCAADLVKEAENGYILDPFNAEKAADTINRIFAASISLKSAGEKSFRMVQSYSLEAAARNLTAALIGIDPANQPGEHIN
jgi:glycosyltransferase involved in cell wall biosynthesis